MTAQDGLTLHVRRYGSGHACAHSVVCLPGLARTAADFHPLATALAADPAKPRLVLALDYRGHGQSQYDRNPKNYTIRVALADLAQRTWREHRGALMPNHDLKLARALRGISLERLPTLWDQFDALAHIPLMVIRGANSDMLASTTLNAMLARRGQLEVVVMPDQGHAPLLAEPNVIRRIAAFVASCDVPARD